MLGFLHGFSRVARGARPPKPSAFFFSSGPLKRNQAQMGVELYHGFEGEDHSKRHSVAVRKRKQIAAYAKLGTREAWLAAKELFHSIPRPASIHCSTLLHVADRSGCYSEGLVEFERMQKSGIHITDVEYARALTLLGREGNYTRAVALYTEMLNKGVGRHNPVCLQGLLNAAAMNGQLEVVQRHLDEASASGTLLDRGHYGSLLKACREAKSPTRALDVLKEMRARAHPASILEYTQAMGACCTASAAGLMSHAQVDQYIKRISKEMQVDGVVRNEYFLEEEIRAILGGARLQDIIEAMRTESRLPDLAFGAALDRIREAAKFRVKKTKLVRELQGEIHSRIRAI